MQVSKTHPKQVNAVTKGLAGLAVILAGLLSVPAHAGSLECATGGKFTTSVATLIKMNSGIKLHRALIKAADCGDAEAQYQTGIWYLDAKNNSAADKATARVYLEAADAQGHKGAAKALGLLNLYVVPKSVIVSHAEWSDPK